MTNNEPTAIDTSARDRFLARLAADRAAYSNPIMPAKVNRPAPRARRTSVRHRSIR